MTTGITTRRTGFSKWKWGSSRRGREGIKLFCIPYAGASASVYAKWKSGLDSGIKLIPVELAGRGRRFKEAFYHDMEEAVEDVFRAVRKQIDHEEYALFGHSMGSLILFDLYYRLGKEGCPAPAHLFFSGRSAPHIREEDRTIHNLPERELISVILKYGGIQEEILANPELREIFLPILRADYRVIESFRYALRENAIDCDITVLNGKEDGTLKGDLGEWRRHAGRSCELIFIQGGHFFINQQTDAVLSIIGGKLAGKRQYVPDGSIYRKRENVL